MGKLAFLSIRDDRGSIQVTHAGMHHLPSLYENSHRVACQWCNDTVGGVAFPASGASAHEQPLFTYPHGGARQWN
jgi:hypothetical protein